MYNHFTVFSTFSSSLQVLWRDCYGIQRFLGLPSLLCITALYSLILRGNRVLFIASIRAIQFPDGPCLVFSQYSVLFCYHNFITYQFFYKLKTLWEIPSLLTEYGFLGVYLWPNICFYLAILGPPLFIKTKFLFGFLRVYLLSHMYVLISLAFILHPCDILLWCHILNNWNDWPGLLFYYSIQFLVL